MTTTAQDSVRTDVDLMVQAAESYYLENKTQAQIATQLGISSSTISRLLTRAREEGIVRINIVRPQARNTVLEKQLQFRFGLDGAIVANIPPDADDETVRRNIGMAAAPYIDGLIEPGAIIGIGRGRSLAALALSLHSLATPRHITIVQVLGEYETQHSSARASEISRQIAEMYDGTSYYLNAPALINDTALADRLLHTPGINQVLPYYDRLDMMLLGVGPLRESPFRYNGLLDDEQIAGLDAAGALGDLCGHFFSEDGTLVDSAYSGRIIGATWEQVRHCPRVVAVAGGSTKVKALQALLFAGLLHVLATDEHTAQQLINR